MPAYTRHHPDSPFWNFLFAKDELDEITNWTRSRTACWQES